MAKFLNTSATNYYLEELIKGAHERLILISPYLKLNDRIKELLSDKNRMKIDVRIVYGKSELQPSEINWLKELTYVRTSFCKNLHAKCYMNEESCIITSLNLYEFSQVNNNEMGIAISRREDPEIYKDAHDEAQRIIRISDEVRISLEKVEKNEKGDAVENSENINIEEDHEESESSSKLSTSKCAKKFKMGTNEFLDALVSKGYLELKADKHHLTSLGEKIGGEFKFSKRFGSYFIWPEDISM